MYDNNLKGNYSIWLNVVMVLRHCTAACDPLSLYGIQNKFLYNLFWIAQDEVYKKGDNLRRDKGPMCALKWLHIMNKVHQAF